MRNPNGYGSVVKLSGNRRKPFMVRITNGYNEKGHPNYLIIGYYPTRKEGMIVLAEYNKEPFDVNASKITVRELFDLWVEKRQSSFKKSTFSCLKSSFNHCKKVEGLRYKELRSYHMQDCIDNCGRSYSTRNSIKALFGHLDKFAMELDVITKPYSALISGEVIPETSKLPFTDDEIEQLWKIQDQDWVDSILILMYSGWRLSELLNLKIEDVSLTDWTMKGGTKTKAGKGRIVPIHPVIREMVTRRVQNSDGYLFAINGKPLDKRKYYEIWYSILTPLKMKHTPHECRHTLRSKLDSAGANKVCIDLIMGHKSKEVGERVYTHKTITELHSAIALVTR